MRESTRTQKDFVATLFLFSLPHTPTKPISTLNTRNGLNEQTEIYELKKTIEEIEAMGGDPLGDLAKQLMQELSERKIQLENVRQV